MRRLMLSVFRPGLMMPTLLVVRGMGPYFLKHSQSLLGSKDFFQSSFIKPNVILKTLITVVRCSTSCALGVPTHASVITGSSRVPTAASRRGGLGSKNTVTDYGGITDHEDALPGQPNNSPELRVGNVTNQE